MLKINTSGTFFWPVTVSLPADGGRFERSTFDAEFKRMKVSEVEAMVARVYTGEVTGVAAVRTFFVGWRGVVDDGQDVPFSEDALTQVLDMPGVANAVFEAFREAMSGKARAKN